MYVKAASKKLAKSTPGFLPAISRPLFAKQFRAEQQFATEPSSEQSMSGSPNCARSGDV